MEDRLIALEQRQVRFEQQVTEKLDAMVPPEEYEKAIGIRDTQIAKLREACSELQNELDRKDEQIKHLENRDEEIDHNILEAAEMNKEELEGVQNEFAVQFEGLNSDLKAESDKLEEKLIATTEEINGSLREAKEALNDQLRNVDEKLKAACKTIEDHKQKKGNKAEIEKMIADLANQTKRQIDNLYNKVIEIKETIESQIAQTRKELDDALRESAFKKLKDCYEIKIPREEIIEAILIEQESVDELDLHNCGIAEFAEYWANALKYFRKIDKLFLGSNKLREEAAVEIFEKLDMENLKELHLDENELTSAAFSALSRVLERNYQIEKLYLGGNVPKSFGIRSISESLSICNGLTHLSLYKCELNDEALEPLCEGLASIYSLESLHLEDNEIGPLGVQKLIPLMKQSREFRELFIHMNRLGVEGVKAVLETVKDINSFRVLWIHNNEVPSDELTRLQAITLDLSDYYL
mmetsp:Transcript_51864/g.59192  ORF Transcript_51864/g.59192 Transcript_51864/m.59192 type:complete len:468 (+) Transcript_51864:109-1512(+)